MGARYKAVFKDGQLFAEYADGELTFLNPEYRAPKRSDLSMPYVVRDIGEYKSPVDGTTITSRSQHREHLRTHDLVEVGNERIGSLTPPPSPATVNRELGEAIKRHVEQVEALPQDVYDQHVRIQQAEHAEIAAAITATE